MNTTDIILNFLYKAESSTVESLSLVLSKSLQEYHSQQDVLQILETLKRDNLVKTQPHAYKIHSSWKEYCLTDKGREVAESGYGMLWDDAAFQLWLNSSVDNN